MKIIISNSKEDKDEYYNHKLKCVKLDEDGRVGTPSRTTPLSSLQSKYPRVSFQLTIINTFHNPIFKPILSFAMIIIGVFILLVVALAATNEITIYYRIKKWRKYRF